MQQVARILRTDAEVAVHGGFVEGSGVALVEFEDGLVPEGTTSEDCGAVVNMGPRAEGHPCISRGTKRISKVSGAADG